MRNENCVWNNLAIVRVLIHPFFCTMILKICARVRLWLIAPSAYLGVSSKYLNEATAVKMCLPSQTPHLTMSSAHNSANNQSHRTKPRKLQVTALRSK